MGIRLAIPVAVLSLVLAGCASVPGSFSPVRGPLAKVMPTPSYPARFTGALSGTISVTVPGDGACRGSWSGTGKQAQSFTLKSDWNLVYGPGYYLAHVLGNRFFIRTTLKCSSGAVIRMEATNQYNRPGHTYGVAADEHGNVFKISVYNGTPRPYNDGHN